MNFAGVGDGTIESKVTANDPTNFYLAIHTFFVRALMHVLSQSMGLISNHINPHSSDPLDYLSH